MGKYDHPSSGDLEHMKFLFNAPDRPNFEMIWRNSDISNSIIKEVETMEEYIEWLEWQLDSQAAHNRISGDNQGYYMAKCCALEAELRKMTKKGLDGK